MANEYTAGSKWAIKGEVTPITLVQQSADQWQDTNLGWWTIDYLNNNAVPYREATQIPGAANIETDVYTHSRWNAMIEEAFDEVRHLAKAKGGEYSGDTDRLLNFRRNGLALDLPMETIWAVYAAKHWDAVMQYIKDLKSGKQRERMEPIDGRIRDLIVYLLLLQAMVEERTK